MTALATTFPGQRLYVPWSKSEAMARFVDDFGPLIGHDKAMTLIDMFGGLRIIVPTRAPSRKPVDAQTVLDMTVLENLTASQIAKLLNCDPRSVYSARARARNHGLKPSHPRRRTKR